MTTAGQKYSRVRDRSSIHAHWSETSPCSARADDGFALGVRDLRVFTDVVLDALLPSLKVRLARWAWLDRAINYVRDVLYLIRSATDKTEQRRAIGQSTLVRYTLCRPSPLARSAECFCGRRPPSSP